MSTFDDVLAANQKYARGFAHAQVSAPPARGLAVLTCMDSRIDPLAALGLSVGDVKVVRNGGGQLTDEMRTDLVLVSHLLNVQRVLIMPHTQCAMSSSTDEQVNATIGASLGRDAGSRVWRMVSDQRARLQRDVLALRADPLLRPGTVVAGAIYDVETGRVDIVIPED